MVIADEHNLVREVIRSVLENGSRIIVVGEASDEPEAIQLVETLTPDVLFFDTNLLVGDGVTAIKDLCCRCSKLPVLILSTSDGHLFKVQNVKDNRREYALKDRAPAGIILAIEDAVQNEKKSSWKYNF